METLIYFFKKRGAQVTIFMIIALILLISGGIFFYFTKEKQEQIKPEIKIVKEKIPFEFDALKKYVNDCVYSVGVEGLKIIGKQGGYISFTDQKLNTESFNFNINEKDPTEGDGVLFNKDSDLKIPYWWYLKSQNGCKGEGNCRFSSKRPELRKTDNLENSNSIEEQLERYVKSRFKDCLDNFKPFTEQGFEIEEIGEIKTDVTIALRDVVVLVEYPLEAEKQKNKAKMTQFIVNIPINLNKIYDLATKITNLELEHHMLEKLAMTGIVAFSGKDKQLPPISKIDLSFSGSNWKESEIKERITEMLASYIQLFQVDGTYNYERNILDSKLKQTLYDTTIIPITELDAGSSFYDLAVHFNYLDTFWPVYFDLNCQGDTCKSSSINALSFMGIQDYKFNYDLSFPVLIEIQEPFALNGQRYTFNFFLESNIRNNDPLTGDFSPLEISSVSEGSLLCDAKTSGNIKLNVLDAVINSPIKDVQVLYTITGESCFIGTTNSEGTMTGKFPVGIGGVINLVKDGFIGKAIEFNPQSGIDAQLNAKLNPIYTKKVVVKKKKVEKINEEWVFKDKDVAVELGNKEEAVIKLTRINKINDGTETELEFSSIADYEGGKEPTEIQIAPGEYNLDISLMLNEKVIIPEKTKVIDGGLFHSDKGFTIPKVDFGDKFPEGGVKLDDVNNYITLNANELETKDTIEFYVISIELANIPEQDRIVEDLEQINKIEDYSDNYQVSLHPQFK